MNPYENVVIGNFLYGLGFAIGAKSSSSVTPSIVSLLQQTPADRLLCDLLLEFPGVVRLIEFKRKENKSSKEKRKHTALMASIEGEREVKRLSKSVHWFVETDIDREENNFIARIVPYINAYPAGTYQDSLEQFIERTAEDVISGRTTFSKEDLKHYLRLVAGWTGSKKCGVGGLLLVASAGGGLNYIELTDITQLRLQHRELTQELILEHQRLLKIDRALTKERSQEPEISRERNLSQGLEL